RSIATLRHRPAFMEQAGRIAVRGAKPIEGRVSQFVTIALALACIPSSHGAPRTAQTDPVDAQVAAPKHRSPDPVHLPRDRPAEQVFEAGETVGPRTPVLGRMHDPLGIV